MPMPPSINESNEFSTGCANQDFSQSWTRDPDYPPPDFSPRTSPHSWSVHQAAGSDNCYESNFYLGIALLSSIPTSIYTKNVFHHLGGIVSLDLRTPITERTMKRDQYYSAPCK